MPATCPYCAARAAVPIVYGLPTAATAARAAQGRLVLGGCVLRPESPDRHCTACGHEWCTRPLHLDGAEADTAP